MVYTYTPTYYSQFQETVSTLCKSILLPFSHKNRRLPADQKLAKRHSDNLKWQQESFHKILNLIGLHKEGIAPETEVSAFRSHMLDTLIASPSEQEPVNVIRDKLLFLQELFYAKCISADEYHCSKRPLLQRLAVQGAEIDCKDVIISDQTANSEEQWSVIELKDNELPTSAEKSRKQRKTPIKSFINWRGGKENNSKQASNSTKDKNASSSSVLMPEISQTVPEKSKRKPFRSLFNKEKQGDDEASNNNDKKKKATPDSKSAKKQWGLDGFKKWRNNAEDDEFKTPYLHSEEKSDEDSLTACTLVASPMGEGPDTRRIKDKIHADGSSSDFFIDKVLGDNIKKELSRIRTELSASNPNLNFSDDQMEAISTRLPVEKSDLNSFFPKSWCDRYGDIVLGVVKKEFKDHVGELEATRNNAKEKSSDGGGSKRWMAFGEKSRGGSERWVSFEENGENFHPNLFRDHPALNPGDLKNGKDCFASNPFVDNQNPFWATRS